MSEQNKAGQKTAETRKAARHARDVDAAEQIKRLGQLIGLGKRGDRS